MSCARSILVLNCGSSSVKFAVYPELAADHRQSGGGSPSLSTTLYGQISGLGGSARLTWRSGGSDWTERTLHEVHSHAEALGVVLDLVGERLGAGAIAIVGHRIVHGGGHYERPVLIDQNVLGRLDQQVPLAPLHQPHNLAGVRAVTLRAPEVPQLACFDTAFHAGQPDLHTCFALPAVMRERGVRRYGFHGLSYQSIADRLPLDAPQQADGRVIVAHLGSGASVCGLLQRRSVRTSMGMTALDGLVMGTRPGSIDIGVALYAIDTLGMDTKALSHVLYDQSGLLGLSGLSADMKTLLASADPRAVFAVEVFCERAAQEIAATAVALGGCDLLVFTAGIGENCPSVRARIAARLRWMGLELDHSANERGAGRISTPGCGLAAQVMATDEQAVIASACRESLLAMRTSRLASS